MTFEQKRVDITVWGEIGWRLPPELLTIVLVNYGRGGNYDS